MTERNRIKSLFEKIYNGSPWIDVTIVSTLENISHRQAHKRIFADCNSIWEITNHLIAWRSNVLKRVQGKKIKTPASNYIEKVENNSAKAWAATLKRFAKTQEQWLHFLEGLKPEQLETLYPGNNMTYYEHIQGILQHDAYHLGQIVLLKKALK